MSDPNHIRDNRPDTQNYFLAGMCLDGLTHDVNNYLGAVMAYSELLEMEIASSDAKKMLDDIIAAVEKSTRLLETTIDIVRAGEDDLGTVDVPDLVGRLADLHSHEMKRAQIEFDVSIEGDLSPITGIKGKIVRAAAIMMRDAIERCRGTAEQRIILFFRGGTESVQLGIKDSSDTPPAWNQDPAIPRPIAIRDLGVTLEHASAHGGTLEYTPDEGLVLTLPRVATPPT